MNRAAQVVVMLLLGGSVLRAGLTDVYLRYVKEGLRPLLLVAGAVLIAAAVATVWYDRKQARLVRKNAADDAHGGHGAPAGHAHREPRISWLLLLPLFALVLVAPPALGSYAANRAGTALQPPTGFADLPADDPLRLSVEDYAGRAVYDHGRSLGTRRVTITGFVTIGRDHTPYLTRMRLSCCAADALPIKVGLTGDVPPLLEPDTWFEITGTYTDRRATDDINGGPIPFITVIEYRHVAAPRSEYQ